MQVISVHQPTVLVSRRIKKQMLLRYVRKKKLRREDLRVCTGAIHGLVFDEQSVGKISNCPDVLPQSAGIVIKAVLAVVSFIAASLGGRIPPIVLQLMSVGATHSCSLNSSVGSAAHMNIRYRLSPCHLPN